ncbi:MAG: VWA domain-containing protein [Pyrinomonadaceae bacterium]|nr:VWA domain-containing protein [Pyrinomonadaceae bacterium]
MKSIFRKIAVFITLFCALALSAQAQSFEREFDLQTGGMLEIINLYGKVNAAAEERKTDGNDEKSAGINPEKVFLSAVSAVENEIKIDNSKGKIRIVVAPEKTGKRIDLFFRIPERIKLRIETNEGEALVSGNLELIEIKSETGTIAADVPLDNVRYDFLWTQSRPRFLSDVELEKVSEKSAGKFVLSGRIGEKKRRGNAEKRKKGEEENSESTNDEPDDRKPKTEKQKTRPVSNEIKLNFTTARGIILLNVPPNEVSSDLRERPLTNAAKAIIRSGDSLLTDAIRRASPKYFGDFAKTLPPAKREPVLAERTANQNQTVSEFKKVLVRVLDSNNRAIAELKPEDFEITEAGNVREVVSVQPTNAPFNLVLLLDVSGSVDNYVNFIRKAARSFVNTVDKKDKVAIVIFNEDVQVISNFTTDKTRLSESLDTFDAGGATALYDSLGFVLTETLRPMKGERTAIVALTDGDDNRSFLSFDSLLGSIQESGALVYPLYVPSSLIASSVNPNQTVDPLRARYTGLTTKAEGEGEKLAKISGGVYYPITQLDQIQKAYDDIVLQLRTAYSVTFRSDLPETVDKSTASPRLKVRVKRENAFVKLGSVVAVEENKTSQVFEDSGRNDPASFFFQKAGFQPETESDLYQSEEISGNVEKIKYKQFVNDELRESRFENFDINKANGAFLVNNGKETIAVSRWISPKRTRSYPYERVYDTLAHPGKKAAIIPVVKDEGLGGERDFLQWDTISLLSLLDVQVILAYYDSAEKNAKRADRITAQKFDNNYILSRLSEIYEFQGTPREWNERETKQLKNVFEKAKLSYQKIAGETKTYLHDANALDELIKFAETPQKFLEFSRSKSQKAQTREFVTNQPKEALSTDTKAKVTITNALFGKYFFTCDETKIENKNVYLIEAKHSVRAKMPSKNDIKDGFIKMMLYINLQNVKVGTKPFVLKVQIRLTANQLKGSINSDTKDEEISKFLNDNSFTEKDASFIKKGIQEARENNFTIILEHAETVK